MTSYKEHLKRVGALVGGLMLVSCQMTNTAAMYETDWICSAFSPISWSINDTLETRMQIYEHNAVWEEFCGVGAEIGAHEGEGTILQQGFYFADIGESYFEISYIYKSTIY